MNMANPVFRQHHASSLMYFKANIYSLISKDQIMETYTIVEAHALSEAVFEMWIHAAQVARHAKAGQFCIIHPDGAGERVPLTISGTDGENIRIAFMAVGTTTKLLATLKAGDELRDVAGPLGVPSDIAQGNETVVIVGGGVGVACTPILARAAKDAGNHVIGIIGARNKDLLIFEDDMREICDELFVTTDDGSYGIKGFASAPLKELCESGRKIDKVWIIGPGMMMKVTSEVTRPYGIKTYVSLNPVMVDGTGMCGSCRVTVGGEMKFACVDGPEFDAHQVDWNDLMTRQRMYIPEEKQSMAYREEHHVCRCRKVE
jgi:ferredoxin--NADP+ reductase